MRPDHQRFKRVVAALYCSVALFGAAQAATLDELFADLAVATQENQARISSQIIDEWAKSGSPAMDLLLQRGKDAIEAGEPDVAIDHLSALIDHAPEFAEGYHSRATAFFLTGRLGPALEDLRQTLVMNPRHFGAMQGVAVILEQLERPEDALEAYRAVLALHPASPEMRDAVARLEQQLEGQAL